MNRQKTSKKKSYEPLMLRVEDQDEFNAKFDLWLETLDYDYKAEENKARFMEDKAGYITENLDHERWSHRLDKVLLVLTLALLIFLQYRTR